MYGTDRTGKGVETRRSGSDSTGDEMEQNGGERERIR